MLHYTQRVCSHCTSLVYDQCLREMLHVLIVLCGLDGRQQLCCSVLFRFSSTDQVV